MTSAPFVDSDRIRKPVRLTLDPTWRARADAMAAGAGLPLSRWLEQLIRAEWARAPVAVAKAKKKKTAR